MIANKLQRTSITLLQQSQRSFARKPMIQFLGPRSKHDKSVGSYASAAASASTEAPPADKKALSLGAELEFADIPADRWARMVISEAEMDIINQGTNDIDIDWRKIKL